MKIVAGSISTISLHNEDLRNAQFCALVFNERGRRWYHPLLFPIAVVVNHWVARYCLGRSDQAVQVVASCCGDRLYHLPLNQPSASSNSLLSFASLPATSLPACTASHMLLMVSRLFVKFLFFA